MNYPLKAEGLKVNDAKLGGKYRMSNVREFIALAYLLYIASERKASVDYSDGDDSSNQLKLNPSLSEKICTILSIDNVEGLIAGNPLLSGQFEYILVAMERVFCLGSVVFNNNSYNNSKERTGGIRYPKTLKFSTNMMVLDLILSSINQELRNAFLKEWLQNHPFSDNELEKRITSFLTICSQYSLFRVRTEDDDEIVYRPIGIYEQIAQSGNVSIVDSREQAGTASIYNNVLKEGLNPWLNSRKTDDISFNAENDITTYLAMLKTSLSIVRVSESDLPGFITPKVEFDKVQPVEGCILRKYLAAIRTKPFILLAGISGTGKSRIVRELAFKSCPEYLQDKDGTTPGNYCMIEVKPNWHDSTELLGYYSNMNKSYQFKKFVKFLVKAKMNPDVPFFVCLDEMNLAPVEHYFAEMLSIMETRKHPKKEGTGEVDKEVIKTGVIVESKYFKEASWKDNDGAIHQKSDMSDKNWYEYFFDVSTMSEGEKEQIQIFQYSRTLQAEGLTLPDNVIIIGTVNMDDTTHQFSRKVIDRAMTIEMNGGKLSNMFGGSKDLEYLPKDEQEKWQKSFRQLYVNADEVLEAHPNEKEDIIKKVPERLENINKALKGTPFEVSYRVLNELTIMVGVLLDSKKESENIDDIIDQALDHILLMKILPRIEGDSEMFNLSTDFKDEYQKKYDIRLEYNNRLEWLKDLAPEIKIEEQDGDDHRQTAREKIQEMIDRLGNQEFTRFWP